MKKKLFIFILLAATTAATYGQHEMTLYQMNNVFQSTYVNPTAIPEQKVSIGLPGISSVMGGVYLSPFIGNDVKTKNADGTYSIDLSKSINKMTKYNNYINTGTNVDLFHLRFKARNLYIGLSATNVSNIRFNFPKDLFSLAWYGNMGNGSNTTDLKNLGINASLYNEYALGFTRAKDGGKFKYGVRVKLLQGFANVNTAKTDASIKVDDSKYYANTLSANAQGYSSYTVDIDSFMKDPVKGLMNFDNKGYGLDFGLAYTPNKKWSFSGSVINIGSITWKSNATSYTINGDYVFKGVNLDSAISNGVDLNAYTDTLSKVFKVKEEFTSKYKTKLTPSAYLSAIYTLGANTKLSLTCYADFYYGIRPAGSLALTQRAGRILNLLLSYNVRRNSYTNMGFGFMLKPGPFQIYVVGDNLLILNPFNSNNFTVRAGMNLVFGRTRKPEMQTHNEE